MKKIKVSICTGTACFVMGASEIMLLDEWLPENLKEIVEIEGLTCLEKCRNPECGKAPFVLINGELMPQASYLTVIDKITELASKIQGTA
ncbi:MAG: NAD(P)H-dependent oxidoreductase subunit E [Bacteroides sp.]|nr:NAD(P)H-dependent oxidoreductase subunit E [Prevotella sp.]MCM1407989.1 NAD(P)H-dependent oxidoreductase subunit E [Treponema brennaborense]MCM1468965.1 NAD(P)H-dependent oxidoreductase subunit E [Bacteroides sp.]